MLTKSIVKKVSSFRSIGKWVFWNPCFTTDCREVYIYYIYNIYISIDTVFRPIRTHQYGSNHQGWFCADGGDRTGNLSIISSGPCHYTTKPLMIRERNRYQSAQQTHYELGALHLS